MRFRFRLARVLRFVELKEREKKMEVAMVVRELEVLSLKKQKIAEETKSLLKQSSTKLDVDWLRYGSEKVALNQLEEKKIDSTILDKKEVLELRQLELGRLGMRKKALESLKEKRHKEFSLEENRKAQTRLDEAYRMSKLGK